MAGCGKGQGLWCGISGREYEPELVWVERRLEPGHVMIDIGANVGAYALRAGKKVAPTGMVIALEPGGGAFDFLMRGVELNGLQDVVRLHKSAAAERDGREHFGGADTEWHGFALGAADGSGVEVEVRSVDSLAEEYGLPRLDVLKIDAEGAEYRVLQGAAAVVRRFRPDVVMEITATHSAENALSWLRNLDYEPHLLQGAQLIPATGPGNNSPNMILLPKERSIRSHGCG